MPAWMTSELRELVWVPNAASASRMTTSRPASASRRATASPTTPAPITAQSILSVMGRPDFSIVSARWDADFLERSPMFAPLRVHGGLLRTPDWPSLEDLERALAARRPPIAVASGASLAFVPQSPRAAAFPARYEPRIYLRGEVQVRERNWHDLMNALVWLTFPRSKAALNARHHRSLLAQQASGAPNRGPEQDAMTLFDE